MTTHSREGSADRLVSWMADHRAELDALMAQEGSRAIHEEFMLAEGGTLPDRATRIERARGASARAWMRHLAQAVALTWPGATPELADAMQRGQATQQERLEALVLEEEAVLDRRGASRDPLADRRDATLIAHARLFAESLASLAPELIDGDEPAPELGRRVAAWARGQEGRRREIEAEARAAWGPGEQPGGGQRMTAAESAPEPDDLRVHEAAAVWAHVRILADALEHVLRSDPETASG